MIIYNVTVNIENDLKEEWVKWMKEVHIPDVMNTGLFVENRFSKVLVDEESGTTYSIQYLCHSMADLEVYQKTHATRLQKAHKDKYDGRFVAFRTLLEVI